MGEPQGHIVSKHQSMMVWRGKPIAFMDRDELIAALEECHRLWSDDRQAWLEAARPLVRRVECQSY